MCVCFDCNKIPPTFKIVVYTLCVNEGEGEGEGEREREREEEREREREIE